MQKRTTRQQEIDGGALPDFLPETEHIRSGDWTVAPVPQDLQDRRVEITGPVDRKMIINALNSPVKVFMADLIKHAGTSRRLNRISYYLEIFSLRYNTLPPAS